MSQKKYYKKRKLNAKGRRKRRRRIIKRILRLIILAIPIILVCMIGSCTKKLINKNDNKEDTSTPQTTSATLLSTGDVILHSPFLTSNHYLNEEGTYDYNSIFTYVKDKYSKADFTIVNLENTITNEEYTAFPLFKGPDAIAAALSSNDVDLCLLANNHIYDNSSDGLKLTPDALEANSLLYTGIRKSSEDKKYKIIEVNGVKIGILNYTYETGINNEGAHTLNSLVVKNEDLDKINSFDYENLDDFYEEINGELDKMYTEGIDYIIAYIHWGTEYQTIENDHQQKIAQKLCELGIDALIGGHPHVIQPVDLLTSEDGKHQMVCIYSVGNHLSNQYKERIESVPEGHTEDGLMVELVIDKDEDNQISLKEVTFIPTWNYRTDNVTDEENPEFFIFPLDDPEKIINKAAENSNLNIEKDVNDSLNRTNAIISEGVNKINQALPIVK